MITKRKSKRFDTFEAANTYFAGLEDPWKRIRFRHGIGKYDVVSGVKVAAKGAETVVDADGGER
jgi:hypothetical protein